MAYWACAQLEPCRERLALHCLEKVAGFTIYCPRIFVPKSRGRRDERIQALFPGYAFVLVIAQWWAARWSPGVVRLVLDGEHPAKVPDRVIADLRQREVNGAVELPEPLGPKPGDVVKILGGPFQGQLALYQGMKPRERVEALLAFLGAQQRLTLARADVEALATS